MCAARSNRAAAEAIVGPSVVSAGGSAAGVASASAMIELWPPTLDIGQKGRGLMSQVSSWVPGLAQPG